mmetsp:Transcript_35433/g.46648  ORF Transcript_35433/g.46648 Transcript_35433/m.46648 type:complete len:127 (-) Transcript_35433:56-436(-)
MFTLLREVRKAKKESRMLRFLGFKTTGGQDMFPHQVFSVTHLFEPGTGAYSSEALHQPALAQGVFLPRSIYDEVAADRELRIYLERTFQRVLRSQDAVFAAEPRSLDRWLDLGRDEKLMAMIQIAA